jgi:glycosyltransferase involved in cell wall biosynthesis
MAEIVVNGRFLSRRVTGVERYGREILSCIGSNLRVEATRRNGVAGHLWEQLILPRRLTSKSVLWSPANSGPLAVCNQALTIHDLAPLERPLDYKEPFSTWYRFFLPLLAGRARVVFTPSRYVQQKVKERFGIQHVLVTPNGVDPNRFFPGAWQSLYELPARYILFVGTLQPRKNIKVLLEAWKEIVKDHPDLWLVISGSRAPVFKELKIPPLERVLYPGYVDEIALPGLYSGAALFVLPSLDEGFGLPALEAMACGTPVIVSDGGALPETAGEAALIFNRLSPGSLAAAMRECLENPDLASTLVAKGYERVEHFSWQHSAELIWNTLYEL